MDFRQSVLISLLIVLHLSVLSASRDNFLQLLPETRYNTDETHGYPSSGKAEVGFGSHRLDTHYDDMNPDGGSYNLEKMSYGRKESTEITPRNENDTDESEVDKIDSAGYTRSSEVSFRRPIWQQQFLRDRMQYFKLALQWPASVCNRESCYNETIQMVGNNSEFKIHGLWPSRRDRRPLDCTGGNFVNITGDLKRDLDQAWPSYYKLDNQGFWKHEWDQHGKCSNLSQFAYFKKTLELYRSCNILNYLAQRGIRPGGTYRTRAIRSAIENKFGGNITLSCSVYNRALQLQEVRLCLLPNNRPCSLWMSNKLMPCQGSIKLPTFGLPVFPLAGSTA